VEKSSNQPSTSKDTTKVQRDEWMSMDTAFGGVTRAELKKKDEKDTANVPSVIDNVCNVCQIKESPPLMKYVFLYDYLFIFVVRTN
jgi:hypothetical protein